MHMGHQKPFSPVLRSLNSMLCLKELVMRLLSTILQTLARFLILGLNCRTCSKPSVRHSLSSPLKSGQPWDQHLVSLRLRSIH